MAFVGSAVLQATPLVEQGRSFEGRDSEHGGQSVSARSACVIASSASSKRRVVAA